MGDIKTIGDREFPMRMTIRDQVQQGSSTELYFEDIKFAVPLQEEVFSVRWLER